MGKSKTVNVGHVKAYLTSLFGAEKKTLEKEKEMVAKYQIDIENIKKTIQKLKNWYLLKLINYMIIKNLS